MSVYKKTVGDRLIPLQKQLKERSGVPVNLAGKTVTFRLINQADNSVKIAAGAVVVEDAAAGRVRYEWQPANVDTAGEYWGWFVVTGGGVPERYPTGTALNIVFVPST